MCMGRAEHLRRQQLALSIKSTLNIWERERQTEHSRNFQKNAVCLRVLDQSVSRVGCFVGRVCLCLSRGSQANGFFVQHASP